MELAVADDVFVYKEGHKTKTPGNAVNSTVFYSDPLENYGAVLFIFMFSLANKTDYVLVCYLKNIPARSDEINI